MNSLNPVLTVDIVKNHVGKWIRIQRILNNSEFYDLSAWSKSQICPNMTSSFNNTKEISTESYNNISNTLYVGLMGCTSCNPPNGTLEILDNFKMDAFNLIGIWRCDWNITKCLFVTDAEFITEINFGEKIYMIKKVKFISLEGNNIEYLNKDILNLRINNSQLSSISIAESMIQSIFNKGGFYFSTNPSWDISRNMRSSIIQGSFNDLPDDRFTWNYNLLLPIIEGGQNTSKWACPIICGFVEYSKLDFDLDIKNNIMNEEIFKEIIKEKSDNNNNSKLKYSQEKIESVELILISRKDFRRHGVRYLSRGANLKGNVSNSVETEQLLIIRRSNSIKIYSYIQYRGSIPLLWQQLPNLRKTPSVNLHKNSNKHKIAIKNHFEDLYNKYCLDLKSINNYGLYNNTKVKSNSQENSSESQTGIIIVANLIDNKHHELILGKEFEKYLKNINNEYKHSNIKNENFIQKNKNLTQQNKNSNELSKINKSNFNIKFCWFDFHKECANMKWENLQYLIKKLIKLGLDDIWCTSILIEGNKLKNEPIFSIIQGHNQNNQLKVTINSIQNGICRTNCIDCLDRTNVVQSVIGRRVLLKLIKSLFYSNTENNNININLMKSPFESIPGILSNEQSFRNIWSNNADALSKLYSGTPAQKTDFTRFGKRTKFGIFQDTIYSIRRFIVNSFIDGYVQDSLYVFTSICSHPNSNLSIKIPLYNKLQLNKLKILNFPILMAIIQYIIILIILLFLPYVRNFINIIYHFGGNISCFFTIGNILKIIHIISYLFEQKNLKIYIQSNWMEILNSLLLSNKCILYPISGLFMVLFIILLGFIYFIKIKASSIVTRPILDETYIDGWEYSDNESNIDNK
ncbi:SacI domain-containing protein [Cryptosporidium serpentis]